MGRADALGIQRGSLLAAPSCAGVGADGQTTGAAVRQERYDAALRWDERL
jgi:hypothetical protein